jgi:hypothetical protein
LAVSQLLAGFGLAFSASVRWMRKNWKAMVRKLPAQSKSNWLLGVPDLWAVAE